ncbi:hypothetical protein [Bacillus sp. FJAT-45350]|uniref:hypothetical protein n=1 Tax=Bacillus sp. FJAT-45350 TaxID=2011014 RepID=UPI000BB98889|nr:hypothetical protein [Bacillus sp. FJAT-45350]
MPLEAISDFIFGNLFFILLILGALFNFFMRGEKKEESPQRRQRRPAEDQVDWKEIFKQEGSQTNQEQSSPSQVRPERTEVSSPSELSQHVEAIEQRRAELLQKKEEIRLKRNDISKGNIEESSPIFSNEIGRKSSSLGLNFNKITNEEAMKGVIWSEVLGKPRAQRPHNSNNRFRRQG